MDYPSFWSQLQTTYYEWSSSNQVYNCEYCQITFQHQDILFGHLSEIHRLSTAKYISDNPNYVCQSQAQCCQMCGNVSENIKGHLDSQHDKLPLEVYFVRFVYQHQSEVGQIFRNDGEEYTSSGIEHNPINDTESNRIHIASPIPGLSGNNAEESSLMDNTRSIQGYNFEMTADTSVKSNTETMQLNLFAEDGQEFDKKAKTVKKKRKYSQCKWCPKAFTWPSDLKRHEVIHTGEFENKCDVCPQAFVRDSQLKAHMYKHTGVKPFSCEYCQKGFTFSHHLVQHKREKHTAH